MRFQNSLRGIIGRSVINDNNFQPIVVLLAQRKKTLHRILPAVPVHHHTDDARIHLSITFPHPMLSSSANGTPVYKISTDTALGIAVTEIRSTNSGNLPVHTSILREKSHHISSKTCRRDSRQSIMRQPSFFSNFLQSRREFAGRRAGVGYSSVDMASTSANR